MTDLNRANRANRVTVSTQDDQFKADFYRTHKHIAEIASADTQWVTPTDMNKSALRENFRAWVMENASDFGIDWQPNDMREDTNKRLAKYTTDGELTLDAIHLMAVDMADMVAKCPYEISIHDVSIDGITPLTHTGKGTELSKLGIEDGKYLKSGNWAWANVNLCYTLMANEQEIYLNLDVQLVSGQLKKPSNIGELGFTQTAFNSYAKFELTALGLIPVEPVVNKATKAKVDKVEDIQDALIVAAIDTPVVEPVITPSETAKTKDFEHKGIQVSYDTKLKLYNCTDLSGEHHEAKSKKAIIAQLA